MPPAKRRKVGLKRIDAALDALRPMGFPSILVRKTVTNLLKVYGGDEGWAFIEDGSYKLLIETMLEGMVENSQNENNEPKLTNKDGPAEDQIVHSPTSNDEMPSPSRTDRPDEKREANTPPLPDFPSVSTPSSPREAENVQCSSNDKLLSTGKSSNLLPEKVCSPMLCSRSTVGSLPPRKSKPCYGWLSSDDEEEEEEDTVSAVATT